VHSIIIDFRRSPYSEASFNTFGVSSLPLVNREESELMVI